jgi:hypothetical protein
MFPWSKRKSALPAPDFAAPWTGSGLLAEEVDVPRGKGGSRSVRCVQLTVADTRLRMHPDELLALVDGRLGIADSMWSEQRGFLAKVGRIPGGSDAAAVTAGLPDEALALLLEPMTEPPLAVLAGEELAAFTSWVHKLP